MRLSDYITCRWRVCARILSVSDAFEAMTSDRPYRKSLPLDVAFSILIKEKGKLQHQDGLIKLETVR